MAEYANDVTETSDIDESDGSLKYIYGSMGGHAPITPAQRASLNSAAHSGGWASMRSTWIGIDDRAGEWLDSMSASGRTALLRLIKRGPVPPS